MKKYYLLLTLNILSALAFAQEEVMTIHRGNDTQIIPTEEIDSITFGTALPINKLEQIKANYENIYDLLNESVQSPLWIYQDFSLRDDEQNIDKITIQSGQILSSNGEGAKQTAIKNGMLVNNNNYRFFSLRTEPIKYIGMKYSYQPANNNTENPTDHIPPCVLLLGQKSDPWGSIIHILFYDNIVNITTRKNGSEFAYEGKNIGGKASFPQKPIGSIYEVSVFIDNDKMYIKKPNGDYLILQDEYYREAFPMACWQIFNKPEYKNIGCIHEIFAGNKPGVEAAYRSLNKIKKLR